MKRWLSTVVVGLAAAGALACSSASTPAGAPAALAVAGSEWAYDLPASVAAGAVTVNFTNRGAEAHQATLARLDGGKSLADLGADLAASHGAPPGYLHFVGGVGTIEPGAAGQATMNLEPGSYAFLCFLPSNDGTTHIAKGMARALTVTAGGKGALPAASATVTGKDFAFDVPSLKAGNVTLAVQNQGTQPHEWQLVALAAGKTVQDLAAYFAGTPQGPPPAYFVGGVAGLDPGGSAVFSTTLKAGTSYAFVCLIPDKDGVPHMAKGMAQPVPLT